MRDSADGCDEDVGSAASDGTGTASAAGAVFDTLAWPHMLVNFHTEPPIVRSWAG